ncbi:hypothetical protein Pla22_34470 [Rubripirellula amarantea]|uniref:Acyl carrier protein phosphodiesterase n=1 Tax=Rubripirellula amarantea TaxID=2527999 RepID=A0A5C5WIQ6_9BACT|nr:hypothetical protein [Rubripirellula amarantea]TWT50704.1 hypothetical protein Pla22_34470 [Rubripirellula amarantea]
MNFLCHALPYLETNPLVAICTGVPDWLSAVDRKVRARRKMAALHLDSDDQKLRDVAAGIMKHIDDDRWFHSTEAFTHTNLELAVELRDLLPGDTGFRPMFVGHIVIEMLLDSIWIRRDRSFGEQYYSAVENADAREIERCVNVITGKPTMALAPLIGRFAEVAFLYDYAEPEGMLLRLNQVMKRVKLQPLPDSLLPWIARTDKLVESRMQRLLTPPDGRQLFQF